MSISKRNQFEYDVDNKQASIRGNNRSRTDLVFSFTESEEIKNISSGNFVTTFGQSAVSSYITYYQCYISICSRHQRHLPHLSPLYISHFYISILYSLVILQNYMFVSDECGYLYDGIYGLFFSLIGHGHLFENKFDSFTAISLYMERERERCEAGDREPVPSSAFITESWRACLFRQFCIIVP